MNNKYTIVLEEDPETGDLMLPFTDEILADVGWQIGDTLKLIENGDGSWTIRKVNEDPETNRTTD